MIEIDDTIVSTEIFEKKFVCDLQACKGACCVKGEGGAPVENEEVGILENIYPHVKPFLGKESISEIERQGTSVIGLDGEQETPLVNNKECVYVVFDTAGIAKCAIEQAYNSGLIDFKKPISCHLYPIRMKKYTAFTALNYHEWEICKPACECGDKLDVKTYKFLKEPLVRKFGKNYYEKLVEADKLLTK